MSIASEITRLQGCKSDIRTALVNKGVTSASTHNMADFAADISNITTGGATITVTYSSQFYNKTMTCTKGTKTYTKTTTSSGSTVFDVDESGTWTITCNGVSRTVDVVLEYTTQMAITKTITVYSAASDTVSFTDVTGAKTVTTNTSGQGSVAITFIPNESIIFTSSVAKNPTDLSADYSKAVRMDDNVTEVYVMPIGACYWYGNLCEWLTGGQNLAGWTDPVAGTTIGNGTANTNSYTSGGVSAGMRGYGTVNKIDITDFDSLKIILTAVDSIYYGCFLQASANKSAVTNLDATPLSPQPATRITDTGVGTLDISSYSGAYGIAEYAYHTSTNTMTALWLE